MSDKNAFAEYLSRLVEGRGATSQLARDSGILPAHISKMCAGSVIPSPDTLGQLIKPLSVQDRAALVVEYLRLHLPPNAPGVQIRVPSDEDADNLDRLERAIALLDPMTRDRLAAFVEAVNRAPEEGSLALQALGSWFESMSPGPVPVLGRGASKPGVEPPLTVYAQSAAEFEARQAARYGGPDEVPGRRVAEEPPGFPAREGAGPVLRVVEPVEDPAAAKELKERKKGRGGSGA